MGQLIGQGHALGKQIVAARKIRVTVSAFFAPGDGAKHANAAGTVSAAQCLYEIAFCMQFVKQRP